LYGGVRYLFNVATITVCTSSNGDQCAGFFDQLKKRRSTAAHHNVTAVPPAEFSLASWSAAVFRRFWIVGSLLRDINPTDPEAKLEYWSV
jgi:hypothetical protein